jgi:hypothetical protein
MSNPAAVCRLALEDATRRWPGRRRDSDGIMGDARHQKTKSDHNLGNAFDVSHDPASGCTGDVIAAAAIEDDRVTYIIWNRRIFNRTHRDRAWKPYHGFSPHTHHCHVSIHPESRNDLRHWGWAPGGSLPVVAPSTPDVARTTTGPATHPTSHAPFPGRPFQRGDRGPAVTHVQARLVALKWRIGVDGIFGTETDRAVRGFQQRKELAIDGIVGSRTWRALFP